MPYGQFLGYEKGEDGLPKIVEKEAVVVRLIYKLFLEGKTTYGIAKYLTQKGVPTPSGKKTWQSSTVHSILKNEKMNGDALLQKSYTVDFLTKKKKINEGEVSQYYVENSYPAIVSPEVFELVQEEFRRRKSLGGYASGASCFSSRIVCGSCGASYGSKLWHSNDKYRRTVWQCNNKFKNKEKCTTPHIYEDTIKELFVEAFNSLIENKEEIISKLNDVAEGLTDCTALKKELKSVDVESESLGNTIDKFIGENTRVALNQQEYRKTFEQYASKYEKLREKHMEIVNQITRRIAKKDQIKAFLNTLEKQDGLLTEFDEGLWCATVKAMIVKSDDEVVFQFKDGTELLWPIKKS